ncbi:hypothetical protein D9611_012466 [Ephemerocybe angulata]|uniref:ubiquitinyl hydrolase 1 n=1 Tax=Ephemerocybe angulata TaxID=980116 RepID=A0A8H5CAW6_9AGAR|nr:hypothetical protein D9611_012466 [Tulosesus angulatus]
MASLPSPASSPALEPAESSPVVASRKRQRSRSMQSDTSNSSSVKRTVSDGTPLDPAVRSPSSDQMSTLTLADPNQEIDSYMADQGEADIPPTISLTPPQNKPSVQNMTPAEKVAFVEGGKQRKMEDGETWYLVSKQWYKRWRKACTGEVDKDGEVSEQELGAVDNSPLLEASGDLISDLTEGIDVEFVPEDVWNAFATWYGPSQHPFPRRVATRGLFSKTTHLEVYPLNFKVYRLVADSPTNLSLGPPGPTIEASISDSVKTLCTRLAEAVKPEGTTLNTPYRVWKLEFDDDWRTIEFPVDKVKNTEAECVEESEQSLEDYIVDSGEAFAVEFKGSGGWLLDLETMKEAPPAIEGPLPLFKSQDGFFNRMGNSSSTTATTKTSNDFYSGFGSKALSNGKAYTKQLEPGTLGLGNMGNTCFMNSALQCLAHTKELAEYFTSGVFKEELNVDNPLGMQGAIAEVFGALLDRIWASSGPSNSYTPREFKQTLQRFAPQFSGYQQHDSQELVAFLLDGLHEDLNRVIKKPYVEKPDWEGGGDIELAKLAKDSWEGYMLRNDSVIVDLFQGQYQSTLVCPECEKVSITFDPFMYLTLPLPVERKWKHTVYYVPWDLDKPHVQVPVQVNREASFKEVRSLLGRWMDTDPDNLLTMEIFQHKFYKSLDDRCAVSDVNDNDLIVCYELPCKARQNWKYEKKDDDPFIIPIFLTDHKPPAVVSRPMYGTRTSPSYFGYPMIGVIEQEQAKSVDAIYDSVIARLERWTSNARDLYVWVASSDEAVTEISPQSGYNPTMESVTEITPEGDVREVQQPVEEADISDEKKMDVDVVEDGTVTPRPIRTKKDLFDLRLQSDHKDYGSSFGGYGTHKWDTWEGRKAEAEKLKREVLLKEKDALYCEFDENMKAYFFGEPKMYEHSRWGQWIDFDHPELAEAKKAGAQKKKQGLSLEDCLEEFVREEQLGEDDLWYCPQCKKHQQATKKFDLWKAPDILVVHLKRFSNNRILRDKIDTHVDFPVEGLDLSDKVGERAVAKRLREQGVELEEFKDLNLDEPLLYDLFAVDEHMGGLGGGHYRAYSSNHMDGKWYHFDDGYVSSSDASKAVNPNAYLLFYRRRTSTPLGGRTHEKVVARQESASQTQAASPEPEAVEGQLPTPPSEPDGTMPLDDTRSTMRNLELALAKQTRDQDARDAGSIPSPPMDDLPDFFEDNQTDQLVSDSYDTVYPYTHGFPLSDRFRKSSPTSSNEAEGDPADFDSSDNIWDPTYSSNYSYNLDYEIPGPAWDETESNQGSPSYSVGSGESPLEEEELNPAMDDGSTVDVSVDTVPTTTDSIVDEKKTK